LRAGAAGRGARRAEEGARGAGRRGGEGGVKSPDQRWVEILEDPGRPPREREGAAQELVGLCRRDEAFRERYLMRFVTLLADEHPAVRGWGIVGVLLCDEKLEHLPRIVRLLEDPSPGVRLQAVHALTPLGIETIRSA